jgi:hypothetical protein
MILDATNAYPFCSNLAIGKPTRIRPRSGDGLLRSMANVSG